MVISSGFYRVLHPSRTLYFDNFWARAIAIDGGGGFSLVWCEVSFVVTLIETIRHVNQAWNKLHRVSRRQHDHWWKLHRKGQECPSMWEINFWEIFDILFYWDHICKSRKTDLELCSSLLRLKNFLKLQNNLSWVDAIFLTYISNSNPFKSIRYTLL